MREEAKAGERGGDELQRPRRGKGEEGETLGTRTWHLSGVKAET